MTFRVTLQSKKSLARLSRLVTNHGVVTGPFFMPIATRSAVKNLTAQEVGDLGAEIILTNTYHAMLTPGVPIIKRAGGVHRFMNWDGPMLSDSGGFQVFSLSNLRHVTERGVSFADPRSGKKMELTPERSVQVQADMGIDIAMAFDDVVGYPAAKKDVARSMERTSRWAVRCKKAHTSLTTAKRPLLFGIVQGGVYKDLRERSARDITSLNFDGYAIGGVAVGEPRQMMAKILNWTVSFLPTSSPRYLMGLGKPEEIIEAVRHGIDMFDCVIPTREARHGRLYLWRGAGDITKKNFYQTVNITNSRFAANLKPINNGNLREYSYAYLHHLFKTGEPLAGRLATLNNLWFYLGLMEKVRRGIKQGTV